jgi:hypothetical protein
LVVHDTLVKADTLETTADTTFKYLKHSPTKAALFSMALPGLGQAYNKRYWKIPIIYAAIGVSAYYLRRNLKSYNQYLKGYQEFSNNTDTSASTIARINDDVNKIPLINLYTDKGRALQFYTNYYRNLRDWSYFAIALSYVLNIIDASVDAYFFYYDISDNLSVKVKPTILNTVGTYSAVGVKLSFDIH